jgi:hypothetical protein
VYDEIQCGLGRTGRLFAHEHAGVAPDVMALAKALAGGLPMGALLATEDAARGFVPGAHASTFGGGPVIAAAALASLKILGDPDFLAEVRAKGRLCKGKTHEPQESPPYGRRDTRGGVDVGPAGGPGRDAGGRGLPGAGPSGQLHPGERHPPVAAFGGGKRRTGPGVGDLARVLEATGS